VDAVRVGTYTAAIERKSGPPRERASTSFVVETGVRVHERAADDKEMRSPVRPALLSCALAGWHGVATAAAAAAAAAPDEPCENERSLNR
jgi:hypothetical protein